VRWAEESIGELAACCYGHCCLLTFKADRSVRFWTYPV
jgi:hypothetical protein